MLPPFAAAHDAAPRIHRHFVQDCEKPHTTSMVTPDVATIEEIINVAFWASLHPEESLFPKISIAYVPEDRAGNSISFAVPLPFDPATIARVAPAVERPGIHLGVWRDNGALVVWGTTRNLATDAFVLEVVQPGLVVVKRRRADETGKYANVAVLQAEQVKFVDEKVETIPERAPLIAQLLGIDSARAWGDSVNVVVQLATSMRSHNHGAMLLIVPTASDRWRNSVVQPIAYEVVPPYSELSALIDMPIEQEEKPEWREAERKAIDMIGGLTAVDGATVLSDQYELLAFGVKIRRERGREQVQEVAVSEPVVGGTTTVMNVTDFGGTRHLSAAQFVADQQDSLALVASQDGRFTAFAWSPAEKMVHAYRVETLLL
jgi:hypothetical protein